ncbi:MAG TPA: ATP-binding protein [Rhizomicrobium sp.]|jgi:hypothetical protein|nr:ATP-binding protein [Rhizomicrobium sp.]
MALTDLRIEEINEAALRGLIEAQVPEGAHYDYKSALPGNADADKREFLKDASAFANSHGGHIVYGMMEASGLPTGFSPLAGNIDAEILRLENILRDALQPRIVGARVIRVPLAASGTALVLRLPRSENGPHRVSYQGLNRYFVRNSAGTHEASVEELRAMFNSTQTNVERVADWVDGRLVLIAKDRGPILLRGGGRLVVHMAPLTHSTDPIDLARAVSLRNFAPMGSEGFRVDYNVDGLIMTRPTAANGYVQLFRDGSLEATYGGIINNDAAGHLIGADQVAQLVLRSAPAYANGLGALEIQFPVLASVALLGVGKCLVMAGEPNPHPLYQDVLRLPWSTIGAANPQNAVRSAFRLAFNALWNAGGAKDCPLFDS